MTGSDRPDNSAALAARYAAFLNATVDAVIVIDLAGSVLEYNDAAQRMFGYPREQVIGENVRLLMPEPYRAEHDDYLRRYRATGQGSVIGVGREVVARRADGGLFPIELSVGEIREASLTGYVGIIRDITKRKQAEAAQRRAEQLAEEQRQRLIHAGRLATLGEMASTIAHEINQPLAAINTYAEACKRLLAAQPADDALIAETLQKMADQALRAGKVVHGLRDFVRRRAFNSQLTNLADVIGRVVPLAEIDVHHHGLELHVHIAPDLPLLSIDAVQIQQVVLNLVRNAVDAMVEAGRVGDVELNVSRDDEQVRIEVVDSGDGVPDDFVDALFEPFSTTKADGVGVGLSISKSIVEAHEGRIWHEPNVPRGSRFIVRLPLQHD